MRLILLTSLLFLCTYGFSIPNSFRTFLEKDTSNINEVENRITPINLADINFRLKKNRRERHPFGINFYGFGPAGLAGVSLDYFITGKINIEIGSGIRNFDSDLGFFAGGKYHFLGNTILDITPYIGIFSGFEIINNDIKNYNLYIPIGIQRIKKNKFSWSAEIAYQQNEYKLLEKFYGGFKLGYRF